MLNQNKVIVDLFLSNFYLARFVLKIYKKYKKNLHMTRTNKSDLRLMVKTKNYKKGRNVMTFHYQQNKNCLHFNLLNILSSDKGYFKKNKHRYCPFEFKLEKKSQEKILMRNIKFSINSLK